jgi:integrase
MPREKFSARRVANLKADPHRQVDYWDQKLPGLSLRISPSGRKTWTVYYRFRKRKRRFSLGRYPSVSLAEARARAHAAFAKLDAQQDPMAEKLAAQRAGTFAELAKDYLEHHAKKHKPKSWRGDQWMINRHLLPRWQHVKAQDVGRPDVRSLMEAVADGGAPVLANRLLALMSKMFNFAVSRDWRSDNPCKGVDRAIKEESRDRVLTGDEITSIWKALDREDPFFRALFRLRFFTAARGGEIRKMRWSNVDLDKGLWKIPREDAKNEVASAVPLVDKAIETLLELRAWQAERLEQINSGRARKKLDPYEPSGWVFPSARGDDEPFAWEQRAARRIRKTSSVDFRPHDIRRTVATMLTEHCDVDRFLLKRILNHVDHDITAVYDRNRYIPQTRQVLEAWARTLDAILTRKDLSKVLPFTASKK